MVDDWEVTGVVDPEKLKGFLYDIVIAADAIEIPKRGFWFTGYFRYRSRADWKVAVQSSGGYPLEKELALADYLVIGDQMPQNLFFDDCNNKIRYAWARLAAGGKIRIAFESELAKALNYDTSAPIKPFRGQLKSRTARRLSDAI